MEMTSKPPTMAGFPPVDGRWQEWLLKELRKQAPKKLPEDRGTFIPKDLLHRYSSEVIIHQVIEEESKIPAADQMKFAHTVHEKARILFLLLVRQRINLFTLYEAVNAGIGDKDLPFKDLNAWWVTDNVDRDTWECDLPESQWQFLAPQFLPETKHLREFEPKIIIPYTYEEECGSGNFSRVYDVCLEPSHQTLYKLPGVGAFLRWLQIFSFSQCHRSTTLIWR
jgi:hypothetical protein